MKTRAITPGFDGQQPVHWTCGKAVNGDGMTGPEWSYLFYVNRPLSHDQQKLTFHF